MQASLNKHNPRHPAQPAEAVVAFQAHRQFLARSRSASLQTWRRSTWTPARWSRPAAVRHRQDRGPEKDSAAYALDGTGGHGLGLVGVNTTGFTACTRDMTTLPRDNWEHYRPDQLAGTSLHDTGQDVATKFGDSSPLNNADQLHLRI